MVDDVTEPAAAPVEDWRALAARRLGGLGIVLSTLSVVPVWLGTLHDTRRAVQLVTVLFVVAALFIVRFVRVSVRVNGLVVVTSFLAVGAVGASTFGFVGGPAVAFALAVVVAGVLGGRRGAAFTMAAVGVVSLGVAAAMTRGWLPVPDPEEILPDRLRPWLRSLTFSLLLTVLIGGLVVWVVEHLEATTARLASEAARRQEAERATYEAQRTQLIGQLAAGLAHDVNNHLGVISMWVSLLQRPGRDVELEEASTAIADSVKHAAALTGRLLVLGRREILNPRSVPVSDLLHGFRETVARLLPADITVEVSAEPDLWIVVDESQLHQVLLNLCLNARDALPDGGSLGLTVRRAEASEVAGAPPSPLGWAILAVRDDGVGMDEATAARALDPFFTTKARGEGTGLGLATVRSIVEKAGGTLDVESAPGRGTTVSARFPLAAPGTEHPAEQAAPPTTLEGTRVLLAEDTPSVLRAQYHALAASGAEVTLAADGDEALARIGEGRFDVFCTDAVMPGAPVRQVIEAFAATNPGAPVLVCSGYVEEELVRRGIEAGELAFLPKPFTAAELVETLARELSAATAG